MFMQTPNPFGGLVDITETSFRGSICPVGTILPWLKSFTNTPALAWGWVECDGSVLSDAASVYNGQTLPNLNGSVGGGLKGYFLRGDGTSGTTTADSIRGHTHTVTTHTQLSSTTHTGGNEPTGYGATSGSGAISSGTTGGSETTPYFYTVVFIMRVK